MQSTDTIADPLVEEGAVVEVDGRPIAPDVDDVDDHSADFEELESNKFIGNKYNDTM